MAEAQSNRDLVAEFESSYADRPPWDIGRPQRPFAHLAQTGRLRGSVLDVGCGTGEHVIMAASAGCLATGVDIAPTAIRLAELKAVERSISARFVVGDVRDAHTLTALGEFDVVLDCGLFHVFGDDDRVPFVASLAAATKVGGTYFMLCFSDEEPPGWGPRRITQHEIRQAFNDGWAVESIEPADIEVTLRAEPVRSWLATIRRT
jgi:SAM-dependent methyltransferase